MCVKLTVTFIAAVRLVYWFLLAGNQLQDTRITAGEFFLTDFPLNLYISMMHWLVAYWVVVVFSNVKNFVPLVTAFNVPLYAMFLVVLLLMQYLPRHSSTPLLTCQIEDDPYWTSRRVINVTYKVFSDSSFAKA